MPFLASAFLIQRDFSSTTLTDRVYHEMYKWSSSLRTKILYTCGIRVKDKYILFSHGRRKTIERKYIDI